MAQENIPKLLVHRSEVIKRFDLDPSLKCFKFFISGFLEYLEYCRNKGFSIPESLLEIEEFCVSNQSELNTLAQKYKQINYLPLQRKGGPNDLVEGDKWLEEYRLLSRKHGGHHAQELFDYLISLHRQLIESLGVDGFELEDQSFDGRSETIKAKACILTPTAYTKASEFLLKRSRLKGISKKHRRLY